MRRILATNGSAIDQAGATTEDKIFVGIFALLTLVLTPTAVHRLNVAAKVTGSRQPMPDQKGPVRRCRRLGR